MSALDGRVAIVTGAARGIGAAVARRLAADGARVVAADVAPAVLPPARPEAITGVVHDVSDAASWERLVADVLAGHGRLDVLVNNAGVYRPQPLAETGPEEWDRHYRVNQLGVYLGMTAVLEPMRAAGAGSIVNVASISGVRAFPGQFAYGATKWAVRGMTRLAAADLGRFGVRVNAVLPGVTDTEMMAVHGDDFNRKVVQRTVALGRMGRPEDVAAAVAFLASDESSHMTGAELVVDGGGSL